MGIGGKLSLGAGVVVSLGAGWGDERKNVLVGPGCASGLGLPPEKMPESGDANLVSVFNVACAFGDAGDTPAT